MDRRTDNISTKAYFAPEQERTNFKPLGDDDHDDNLTCIRWILRQTSTIFCDITKSNNGRKGETLYKRVTFLFYYFFN